MSGTRIGGRARRRGAWMSAVLCVAGATFAARAQDLTAELSALIGQAKLGKASVGISVLDSDRTTPLAAIRAGDLFAPASNMKVLSSGAAILVLGNDFTFRTEIRLVGSQVVAIGSGDPALADPELLERMEPKITVDDVLDRLADAVAQRATEPLSALVTDDRIFDRAFVHSTWPQDQLNRWYCAEVSGLNFHANVLGVFPRPNPEGPGKPPVFDLQPSTPGFEIENKARTVGDGKNSVWLTRSGDDRFTMFGEVRYPSRVPVFVTVHDAPAMFGRLLANRLERRGVAKAAGFEVRAAVGDERFEGSAVAVVKTPLEEVLVRCNKDSHNLYAEALLKRVGHEVTREPGSWENGSAVLRMLISERLGPDLATGTALLDGSGLSRENRVSPLLLTRWMDHVARDKEAGALFVRSLPSDGEGTLAQRFRDAKLTNELRAKSGAINQVRCLSGFVIAPSGRRLTFSVLVNGLQGDTSRAALKLHEDVVRVLDRWLARREPAESKLGG